MLKVLLVIIASFGCKAVPAAVADDTLRTSHIEGRIVISKSDVTYTGQAMGLPAEAKVAQGQYKTLRWFSFSLVNDRTSDDTLFMVNSRYGRTLNYLYNQAGELMYADTTGSQHYSRYQYFPDFPYISTIPLSRDSTYRLWLGTTNTAQGNIHLLSVGAVYEYIYQTRNRNGLQMLVNTLGIGFLSFIFLFFLFYAIVAKQRVFTLYTIYLFVALVFCFSLENEFFGYAQSLVNQLSYLRYFNETAVAWMFVFYIFFADALLDMSKQDRILKHLLRWVILLLGLYGLFQMFTQLLDVSGQVISLAAFSFRIFFLPVYVILLVIIIIRIRSPVKPFFLIANVFLLFGVVVSVAIDFTIGILHLGMHEIYSGTVLQVGIVGETICFSFALGYYSQLIRKQRDEKVIAQAEMEKRIQQISIRSLEAQMNPHFLFNGINAVRDLMMKDQKEEALNYMNALALLLRTSLINGRKDSISLADELESVKHYLSIERLRLGTGFHFDIKVDESINLHEIEVPPRLLQPIVENAIKHGLRPSGKEQKNITISLEGQQQRYYLTVTDNGIGLSKSHILRAEDPLKSTMLGLSMTLERLAIYNEREGVGIKMEVKEVASDNGEVMGTAVRFIFSDNE
ncbi:sensor histidine kinase [Parapedobacter tibetensis]|uniref:sensor histidine kinase n=1 Tax=Parapedobacter tibetensis TaxID=2972951 RepID=UPI00214DB768|nr:histidine kinase [Parapedobacter tibetensis]